MKNRNAGCLYHKIQWSKDEFPKYFQKNFLQKGLKILFFGLERQRQNADLDYGKGNTKGVAFKSFVWYVSLIL